MSQNQNRHSSSRRQFLKTSGQIAAVSALAGAVVPRVHAAENNTIQVVLVGCGGRGTGAAANALSANKGRQARRHGRCFRESPHGSYGNLKQQFRDQVDVPAERKFVGFDAYQKAMDCLKPGDVAIFTTPLAFRWVHFTYAIEKNLNVFMEKPLTADGPTSRRMLKLAEEAAAKNLKVGVGLMSRHSRGLAGIARAHPGRRDRRHHRSCAATACTGRSGRRSRPSGRAARANCSGRFAFSQLHLGQRRLLQRLLHPHHRSSLLDEERLAGQGPGPGRHAITARPRTAGSTWTRISMSTRWNTPSPTAPSCSWTDAA